jgi:hypothetical protein
LLGDKWNSVVGYKVDYKVNYLNINKEAWDNRTKVHVGSKFYDIEAFKGGRSSLNTVELEQVINVKGKKLWNPSNRGNKLNEKTEAANVIV